MKIVKGFRDILPYGNNPSDTSPYWSLIVENLRKVMSVYNFSEIITPVIEYTHVFERGMGLDTDIHKQMYDFVLEREPHNRDEGDSEGDIKSYCLRPEGTAAIVRSFIENSLYKLKKINKLFYLGPMFRYERMQKGRYRMFHQVGIEVLGSEGTYHEVETLNLAKDILDKLEIKNYVFQINTIGDTESLKNISIAIKKFTAKHRETLSNADQEILSVNPLRFLDKAIHKYNFDNIPKTIDYVSNKSLNRFKELIEILDSLNFKYNINHQLVRGIDYYNDLVFEVVSKDLGAQDTILAGGRYDNLVKRMGGPDTKAIGFAAGIERIILLMDKQKSSSVQLSNLEEIDFYIAYQDPNFLNYSFKIANQLRRSNFKVEIEYDSKSFVKQMKTANKLSCRYVVIIGNEEFNNSLVKVKKMSTGEERVINLDSKFMDVLLNEILTP
jgi:histidyl-tRNA synthetase